MASLVSTALAPFVATAANTFEEVATLSANRTRLYLSLGLLLLTMLLGC